MRLHSLIVTLLTLVSATCFGYDLKSQVESQSNLLGISGEMSSFQLDEGRIVGTGIRLDFAHSFSPKWGIDLFLSTALGNEQGVSASFTGFGGYAFYNLFSECCDQNRALLVDGVPVVSESQELKHLFQIGLGINQFLLNGSKGVYSSSGLGFGVNYYFRVMRFHLKASARQAQMISNENKVQGTFLGLGIVFPL